MFGKTKTNFWLDIVIFTAFLATAITGLLLWLVIPGGRGSGNLIFLGLTRHTWVDLHNWAGLAMLIGAVVHLILHWKWLICVAERFFKKLARQARLNFSLDSLLFVAFFLVSLSGLVSWLILPSGGYRGGRNPFYNATLLGLSRHDWNNLHLWAGLAMIAILTVHLALHWRWIVCTAHRYAQATVCNLDECVTADSKLTIP
jgi:fucose 4-O-acetylase-like acetyltransferase